ncbi:TetR/AcrR family transcriptional regulator [Bradyrhizobium japonicum]|uniref:TetR/AcrR family transcriptional regulator n=1 Tax=Bradyrhizobium japonicum TaxID=375 RepID=UPI0005761401|nr:helix-turn-helix domain-containing protein [Bradyrhizobium japonicum]
MTHHKTHSQPKLPTRDRVLDAAERLLAVGSAAFSMRELAEEAGVSFATPFNQFGSKAAIMLALSARLIASMQQKFAQASLPDTASARALLAVDIAVSVMLAAPGVNRAIMSPSDDPGEVSSRSAALWAEAFGDGTALLPATRPLALAILPNQLATAFRGVLSFWTAGEIPDRLLKKRARAAAATVLLGFVSREDRIHLICLLQEVS